MEKRERLEGGRTPWKPPNSKLSAIAVETSTTNVWAELEAANEDHPNCCVKQAQPPPLKLPDPSPREVADKPLPKADEPPAMVNLDEA